MKDMHQVRRAGAIIGTGSSYRGLTGYAHQIVDHTFERVNGRISKNAVAG